MLTFDEFRAVSKRERDRVAQNEKTSIKNNSKDNDLNVKNDELDLKDDASINKSNPTLLTRIIDNIGEFLESYQMQFLYVLFIILDTFSSLSELYISYEMKITPSIASLQNVKIIYRILQSFSLFTMLFFIIEIVLVFFIFGFSVFGHWGYLLDLLTLCYQVYLEQINYGKLAKLFNILRFWRLIRLFNSMVGIEKDLHNITLMKLETSEIEIKKLNMNINNLQSDVLKEKEARNSIEDMLQNYKEEVDTLNEALKIAAMDIAEVAQTEDDFLLSDEEEDIEDIDAVDNDTNVMSNSIVSKHAAIHNHKGNDENDEDQDEIYVDATTSKFSRKGNKTTVMRAVMDDSSYNSVNTKSSSFNSSTFLVHEDGTFEQK